MPWEENVPAPEKGCVHDIYDANTTMCETGDYINISTAGTFPILRCSICGGRYCEGWGYEQN
jgi:hypothetical protein